MVRSCPSLHPDGPNSALGRGCANAVSSRRVRSSVAARAVRVCWPNNARRRVPWPSPLREHLDLEAKVARWIPCCDKTRREPEMPYKACMKNWRQVKVKDLSPQMEEVL